MVSQSLGAELGCARVMKDSLARKLAAQCPGRLEGIEQARRLINIPDRFLMYENSAMALQGELFGAKGGHWL